MVYCSQLRTFVSVVAKVHLFAHMCDILDGRLPRDQLIKPNHNYFSRVKTMVLKGKLNKRAGRLPPYDASLRAAVETVKVAIPVPRYEPGPRIPRLPDAAITQLVGFQLKQLAENTSTHVNEQVVACINNWLENQLRARLPDATYNDHRRVKPALRQRVYAVRRLTDEDLHPDRDLKQKYDDHWQQ